MVICSDTMWPMDVPYGNLIAWGITCTLIAPCIVALNIILIYAIIKTKETTSFTSRFVLCMSMSDIATGIIVMPLLCSMLFVDSLRTNCHFQKVVQCIAYIFGYTSFFMLIAIGVDRYLLITKLLKYRSAMNNFRFKIIVSFIFMTSTTLAILTVSVYNFPMHFVCIVSNIICIGSVYVLYAKLLLRIDKQAAAFQNDDEGTKTLERKTTTKGRRRKRDIAVMRTIRLLLGTIFVLYMPYNVISLIWTYYKFQLEDEPGTALNITVFWTYMFMFFNCIANVLIYGNGNSTIRRYIKTHTFRLGSSEKSGSQSKTVPESDSELPLKNFEEKKQSP